MAQVRITSSRLQTLRMHAQLSVFYVDFERFLRRKEALAILELHRQDETGECNSNNVTNNNRPRVNH
jgi:hypothetical protein